MTVPESVSVIIPNYNGAAHLEACLSSLLKQTYDRMEILVVDNASQDSSPEVVRRIAPQARILHQSTNLGFAGAANVGIQQAKGEWVAILNNDAVVTPNWLEECVAASGRHPEASFLACRILDSQNPDRLYSAGDCFLRAGVGYRRGQEQRDRAEYRQETEIFSASGCAALYRKAAIREAGGYDQRLFAYLEDTELGLRLQAAGHIGYYVPRAEVYHRGGATSGGEFSPLAVRLRTRNSLCILIKSLPARILWRSAPMIMAAQLAWFGRVVARLKILSYFRGLAGVVPLVPAMLADRRRLCRRWRQSPERLWQAILRSEAMARADFVPPPREPVSFFLKWYFRMF